MAEEKKTYQVFGLTYNTSQLLATIGLLLIGQVTVSICIGMVPTIVPLKLKELGISSTMLVFIMTTFGQILNMTICPWVSFRSDRYRSKRWGRRVPFILFTLPMLCLSWAVLALYKYEAQLLHKIIAPLAELSQATLAIIVLAVGVILFKFFYMYVGSVWYYIPNDVIPPQVQTRFYGAINIVISASWAIFNYFFFKYALSHFSELLYGTIILYVVGMGTCCLLLKEPRFPEPDEQIKKKSSGLQALVTFSKESLSHPIYWYSFFRAACASIAGTMMMFVVFFQQTLGLSLGEIGKLSGTAGICLTVAGFFIATIGTYIVDRWHPVRVSVFMTLFSFLVYAYECKWVFFQPSANVYWWTTLLLGQVLFFLAFAGPAGMPSMMRILPKSRFGSFCSARSLFGSVAGLVFALLLGVLLDYLRKNLGLGDQAYRFIYLWRTFFCGLGIFCYMMLYYYYCKLGGYKNYHAPAPWEKSGFEKMEVSAAPESNPKILKWVMFGFDVVFLLNILVNLGWSFYAAQVGAVAEQKGYLFHAVPVAIIAFALYLTVRFKIMSLLRRRNKGEENISLPHHGILLIVLIVRSALFAALGLQAYLAIKSGGSGVASGMSMFEAIVDCILVLLMWIFVKLETGKFVHTETHYEDEEAS